MRNEATPYGGEYPSPPVSERGLGYAVLDEESGERFVAPAEFAGYSLHDPLGREIGKVDKLFANGEGEAEYVAVKVGVFRIKTRLIPVETVGVDEERRILSLK